MPSKLTKSRYFRPGEAKKQAGSTVRVQQTGLKIGFCLVGPLLEHFYRRQWFSFQELQERAATR